MKHVINCYPSGKLSAVHNEDIPISPLGKSTITRASDVGFNMIKQKWVAIIRPEFRKKEDTENFNNSLVIECPWVYEHESRKVCIEWEINYLNHK